LCQRRKTHSRIRKRHNRISKPEWHDVAYVSHTRKEPSNMPNPSAGSKPARECTYAMMFPELSLAEVEAMETPRWSMQSIMPCQAALCPCVQFAWPDELYYAAYHCSGCRQQALEQLFLRYFPVLLPQNVTLRVFAFACPFARQPLLMQRWAAKRATRIRVLEGAAYSTNVVWQTTSALNRQVAGGLLWRGGQHYRTACVIPNNKCLIRLILDFVA
jgi:hypothetical protein